MTCDALSAARQVSQDPWIDEVAAALSALRLSPRLSLLSLALPPIAQKDRFLELAQRPPRGRYGEPESAIQWLAALLKAWALDHEAAIKELERLEWRLSGAEQQAMLQDLLFLQLFRADRGALRLLQRESFRVLRGELGLGSFRSIEELWFEGIYGLAGRAFFEAQSLRIVAPLFVQKSGLTAALTRLGALQHDHLAPLLQADAGSAAPCWGFECASNLRERPDTLNLSDPSALRDLASGLLALHEAGLCHGAIGFHSIERQRNGRLRWTAMQPLFDRDAMRRAALLSQGHPPYEFPSDQPTAEDDIRSFAAITLSRPEVLQSRQAATLQAILQTAKGGLSGSLQAVVESRSWSPQAPLIPMIPVTPETPVTPPRPPREAIPSNRREGPPAEGRDKLAPEPVKKAPAYDYQSLAQNPKALGEAALRVLVTPRSRDEACLAAEAQALIEMALAHPLVPAALRERITSLRPSSEVTARRERMSLVRPVHGRAFLIETELRPFDSWTREAAQASLAKARMHLPTQAQWQAAQAAGVLKTRPGEEWLREARKSGRVVLARAVNSESAELSWLPAHRACEGISARGVVELFGRA